MRDYHGPQCALPRIIAAAGRLGGCSSRLDVKAALLRPRGYLVVSGDKIMSFAHGARPIEPMIDPMVRQALLRMSTDTVRDIGPPPPKATAGAGRSSPKADQGGIR